MVKVLYHFPCIDGITAALACHFYHIDKGIPVQFIPHTTYNPLNIEELDLKVRLDAFFSSELSTAITAPSLLQPDDLVYLLDYSGPPGFAEEITNRVSQCIVIDHHKTGFEYFAENKGTLPSNLTTVYDMNKSGATLSLEYFKPTGLTKDNIEFFNHVEDGDIWRWSIPGSKAFYAGLATLNLNYNWRENPEIFDQILALSPSILISKGELELDRQRKLMDAALKEAFVITFDGGFGAALAVTVEGELIKLRSQLGHDLAVESEKRGLRGIGAVVYREPGMAASNSQQLKVSLRSVGDADSSEVSKAFGGGGHKNASSFMIDSDEFERWNNNNNNN